MAASDLIYIQRNAGDTGFDERIVSPAANTLAGYDASKVPVGITIGAGLSLSGNELSAAIAVGDITGLGANVATALAVAVGTPGAFVVMGGALGTPSSGTVTNLTGTASININGTVGETTPNTVAATTVATAGAITTTLTGQTPDTYINGLSLVNSTTAAASDQQYSPSLILTGQGWKTNATAASQQVDWRITNVPAQSASAPTTTLSIASQVNGGGYTDRFTVTSAGNAVLNSLATTVGLEVGGTGYYNFNGRSTIYSSGVGILTVMNEAETAFTRLNFGGTTSGFVALQSSGTTLTVGTADGGTGAGALTVSGVLTASTTIVAATSIELGHATENTLTAASGVLSIEGVAIPTISSTSTLTNKTLSTGTVAAVDLGWADGVKQTFNPDATNAGINVGSIAGDPSSLANGDLWYDSTANELSARINGATVALGADGSGSVATDAIWAAKGDIVAGTGADTAAIISAGANGRAIVWDSAEANGIKAGPRPMLAVQTMYASQFTNLPSAIGFWGGTTGYQFSVKVDLTHYTEVRLACVKTVTPGSAGTKIIGKYHATFSTTASAWSDIGTTAVEADGTVAAGTDMTTGWIALAAGAKADVFVSVLGYGGDGFTDPFFGNVYLEFR